MSWCGRSEPAAVGSKSSSTMATTLVVEVPGVVQRSDRPATEEDRKGERFRSSTVSTPPKVDVPREAQRSDRPAVEEDHR
jgi:hypothetical protein